MNNDERMAKAIQAQKRKNAELVKQGKPPQVYNLLETGIKGEPTSVCTKCGRTFDQELPDGLTTFTNWKTCPECRATQAKTKEDKVRANNDGSLISIKPPPYTPYPWQEEAARAFETHRFVVLSCGNRSGKDRASTMIGIRYFLECLNENRQIEKPEVVPSVLWWIVAPTERMAKQNWRELKQFFPKELVVAVADSTLTMATVGGGIIEVRSGYDGQQLVGVGLDLVTITEAARMNDLMMSWANIQARLDSPDRGRDKDRMGSKAGYGKAIINSSPLGKNDFYDLFCFGQKDHPNYNSEWWSAQYPWTANPAMAEAAQRKVQTKFGEITYEEQLRRQMPDHMFRSNYLGEFVSDLGNVFRSFEEKCVFDPYSPEHHLTQTEIDEVIKTWQSPKIGESYVGGYDPATGSSGDSPAFVIREVNSNRIVRIYDLYGKTYEQQYNFIAEMCKQFNYAPIYWLRTGHTAIEGQFERRGIAEFPLDEQAGKKAKLVQTLELAVENGDVQIINDRKPVTQTLIYEMADYSEKNGRYANDKTPHDDFVSALYAAFSDYTVEKVPVTFCGLMGGAN